MMRTLILILSCTMLIAGCLTAADLDKRLAGWVGLDADDVATAWGAPYGTYDRKDGTKIISYERSSVHTWGTSNYRQTGSRHCQVHFIVDKANRVTEARWNGAVSQCDAVVLPAAPVKPVPAPSPVAAPQGP